MTGIDTQQILLPKKVYIGDSAELRCTFNSNSLYLKDFVGAGKCDFLDIIILRIKFLGKGIQT